MSGEVKMCRMIDTESGMLDTLISDEGTPVSRTAHPVSRFPRRAFTLIELLLAMTLASLILVSAAGLLFNVSELYFTEQGKPDHDMHVVNVSHFLQQIFQGVAQADSGNSGSRNSNQASTPIQWNSLPGDSLGEKDHLSFQYEKNIPIIYWEYGPLPALTAWLHHEPDEGLFLFWQTTRQAQEDPNDYMRSLISPYVTELHYEYYDIDMDRWEEDKDFLATEKLLPDMIRIVFEWPEESKESEDDPYETTIILPVASNGTPIY